MGQGEPPDSEKLPLEKNSWIKPMGNSVWSYSVSVKVKDSG